MNPGNTILVSGGGGYIGSNVVLCLRNRGFAPVVIDSLVNGHRWATKYASIFREGDIADTALVRDICATFKPVAAMHFAAFVEVGESISHPGRYFCNNRDKASYFFDILAQEGVNKIVFSSTAAVYGEISGSAPIAEDCPTHPINPYGQSKLEAECRLRAITNMKSVSLRYFNVAGAAPEENLGEAHFPESHLIPRAVIPLLDTPGDILAALNLSQGFKIYGDDHGTPDGTAIRDYVHVLDLADAHIRALNYLLKGGATEIFNLGGGSSYSVLDIVQAVRDVLDQTSFNPEIVPRRPGDPARLVASNQKIRRILGWAPERDLRDMIRSAAAWHRSATYLQAVRAKARTDPNGPL